MSFWKKHEEAGSKVIIHYCEKHDFRTSNPLEIEEHERIHEIEESGVNYH
jgi:hypothetical protein